jgi:hypothetical protein
LRGRNPRNETRKQHYFLQQELQHFMQSRQDFAHAAQTLSSGNFSHALAQASQALAQASQQIPMRGPCRPHIVMQVLQNSEQSRQAAMHAAYSFAPALTFAAQCA